MRKLLPIAIAFLVGVLIGSCRGANPASELRAAVNDLRANVSADRWRSQQYLSLYNVADSEREVATAVVAYVANTVSRSSTIASVAVSGNLIRVDRDAFVISREAWEALGSEDPYWHFRTRIADPKTGKVSVVFTDAPHVDLTAAAELRAMTGSAAGILRADWFVAKASQPPHYYKLAAIPSDIGGWYKAIGIDTKTIVELQANRGANLFRREPTQKPGRISRYAGPLGAVWQTFDGREDDPDKDPFRNPTFRGKFDAMETIAARPNGLLSYGLYDDKGQRQDAAPDDIAKDHSDPAGDGRLVAMLSCVRCHTTEGYRGFSDDLTALANSGVDLHLSAKDAAQLAAFYGKQEQLAKEMRRDMEDYAAAVKLATAGKLTANQIPAALGKIVRDQQYDTVNNAKAMRELGVDTLAPLFGSTDVYLLAIATGHEVSRKQWEASFNDARSLCIGVKP